MRRRLTTSAVGSTASRSCVTVDAELLELARHQRARADERDVRAELEQRVDVRARDAAEEDVADDRDVQPGDRPFLFADGEEVEQRLRGMLVRAVAGVDHARAQPLGEELRRAGGAVAQHDDVGVIRLEILRGVLERFAFREAGSGGGDIDHVGAQAYARRARTKCGCACSARRRN